AQRAVMCITFQILWITWRRDGVPVRLTAHNPHGAAVLRLPTTSDLAPTEYRHLSTASRSSVDNTRCPSGSTDPVPRETGLIHMLCTDRVRFESARSEERLALRRSDAPGGTPWSSTMRLELWSASTSRHSVGPRLVRSRSGRHHVGVAPFHVKRGARRSGATHRRAGGTRTHAAVLSVPRRGAISPFLPQLCIPELGSLRGQRFGGCCGQ